MMKEIIGVVLSSTLKSVQVAELSWRSGGVRLQALVLVLSPFMSPNVSFVVYLFSTKGYNTIIKLH